MQFLRPSWWYLPRKMRISLNKWRLGIVGVNQKRMMIVLKIGLRCQNWSPTLELLQQQCRVSQHDRRACPWAPTLGPLTFWLKWSGGPVRWNIGGLFKDVRPRYPGLKQSTWHGLVLRSCWLPTFDASMLLVTVGTPSPTNIKTIDLAKKNPAPLGVLTSVCLGVCWHRHRIWTSDPQISRSFTWNSGWGRNKFDKII